MDTDDPTKIARPRRDTGVVYVRVAPAAERRYRRAARRDGYVTLAPWARRALDAAAAQPILPAADPVAE